ncbi:MAG: hypothetical protein IPF92_15025 [Myxococcales bacterium]|jgi:hypothetical protein|nr:hypothetical protein [Myxococcales bacterium]HQY60189.1 hypothetical protein [Polyangiaceae bacterium]
MGLPRVTRTNRVVHLLAVLASWVAAVAAGSDARAEPWPRAPEDVFVDGDRDAFDPVSGRPGAPGGGGAGLYVALSGSLRRGPSSEERAAYVVLGLPLDALLDGRPRAPSPQHALYTDVGTATANALPVTGELPPPSPLLARAVARAALRAAGVDQGHARLDDLASRARRSALLPETRLRATRYVDDRASVDALPEQSRLVDSSSHTIGLEARLTFRLDRLVFADEETHLERARLDLETFRARLTSRALDLLFRHHRARLAAARAVAAGEREERAAEVAELAAALDALTGGYYSRAVTP